MKSVVKKIAIYSMIGIMQIGFGASVIEASPLQNDPSPMQQRFDRPDHRQGWHERERFERERHERERIENERHEREMKRRPHETRKQWRERQKHENERHERELYKIRQYRHPWHP
jgi:membrane protein involved in colicin uptake